MCISVIMCSSLSIENGTKKKKREYLTYMHENASKKSRSDAPEVRRTAMERSFQYTQQWYNSAASISFATLWEYLDQLIEKDLRTVKKRVRSNSSHHNLRVLSAVYSLCSRCSNVNCLLFLLFCNCSCGDLGGTKTFYVHKVKENTIKTQLKFYDYIASSRSSPHGQPVHHNQHRSPLSAAPTRSIAHWINTENTTTISLFIYIIWKNKLLFIILNMHQSSYTLLEIFVPASINQLISQKDITNR